MNGWVGVDLDGTLAEHYWGKPGAPRYDELVIGAPIPAMVERVREWIAQGHEVRIMTARVGPHGSAPGFVENIEPVAAAIRAWTLEHVGVALEPTCTKDYNMIALWDDRAVRVRVDKGVPCCGHHAGALDAYGFVRVINEQDVAHRKGWKPSDHVGPATCGHVYGELEELKYALDALGAAVGPADEAHCRSEARAEVADVYVCLLQIAYRVSMTAESLDVEARRKMLLRFPALGSVLASRDVR